MRSVCYERVWPVEEFSANGEQCLNRLCQLRGQAQFLGIEHSFRWVTEEGTRHPHRSFFDGYVDSLNSLHGWADGDPFYVSYVGHPMQGAVAGFLFVQN